MTTAVVVPSGSTNVQAFTGICQLAGISVREDAATPAEATFRLRDGTVVTDPIKVTFSMPGSGGHLADLPLIDFTAGIFVERVGTSELVLYLT